MIDVLRPLELASDTTAIYCSLPDLEAAGLGSIARLPVSLRIVLESVLRNGHRIPASDGDS